MLVDSYMEELAGQLGASPTQILLIVLLVLSIPLSLIFPLLPSSKTSSIVHVYSIAPAILFFALLDLLGGFFQLLISALGTYYIVKLGPKNSVHTPWAAFAFSMGHLVINHIIRYVSDVDASVIEISGSQMVLVMKLVNFAWGVHDGQRPPTELDATQKKNAIREFPSLLEFLGYVFFFPSILVGPALQYNLYTDFTSKTLFLKEQQHTDDGTPKAIATPNELPPGRRTKALKRFTIAIVFLAIYSFYGGNFSFVDMTNPAWAAQHSFVRKFLFCNVCGLIARAKYYSAWCLAESACIMSGIGYNAETRKYNAARNVRIRGIEFAPNLRTLLDNWNINTNIWLRECIYKRVTPKGVKPGFWSTQVTFITSGLWHGVNLCYLMSFVLAGFYQSVGRSVYRNVRPFFYPPKFITNQAKASMEQQKLEHPTKAAPILELYHHYTVQKLNHKAPYDVVGWVATMTAINFAVAPFVILNVRGSLQAWKSVGFYGIWMAFIPFVFFSFGGDKYMQKRLKLRDETWALRHQDVAKELKLEIERLQMEEHATLKQEQRHKEGIASLGPDVEELITEANKKTE